LHFRALSVLEFVRNIKNTQSLNVIELTLTNNEGGILKRTNLIRNNVISALMLLVILIMISCTSKKNQQQELKTWKIPNIGEAAEAYFSPDSKALICTAKREGDSGYLAYTVNIDGTDVKKIDDKGEAA